MTPFYTPPLTPNNAGAPTAVVTGLGGTSNQPRPLPLAHHPGASLYQGPVVPPPPVPSAAHLNLNHHVHPSNYLVAASPHHHHHHSIQPSPTAPGWSVFA